VSELTPERGGEETAEVRPIEHTPDHTLELRGGTPAALPPGLWLVFLLVAAAALLVGIGVAAATRPTAPGSVIARATVGPDGATIAFSGKGRLRIPDGALSRATRIVVRRSVVPERLRVQPPQGPVYVFEARQLVAYTFAPAQVVFARPVTIVLPLDQTKRNATALVVVDKTILFLGGNVDPNAGTVTLTVSDFRFQGGQAPGGP
jgi:hypothetical protein